MDVSKLQIIIETKGVEAAQRELDKLGKNSGNAEKSVGGLASSMKALGAIASLGAMATLAKEYAQVTDSMKLLEARIKLVSSSSDNYKAIQLDMTRIANENGIAIKNVGELYTKLSTALKPLGVTTSSVMQVTDAFSKTLLISGASTEEASSATLQFAQAMASGRLQGDEFRSMAENSPRFMKAMTDSLGKTSAELRQMAEDGKLTSSVVGGALIDSMVQLKQEARDMPMTVGKAFNELKNEVTITVEQFDKLTGINDTIAKGFQGITDKVVGLRGELPKLSAELEEWRKQNEKGFYTLGVVGGEVAQVTWDALKLSASGWKNVADWTMYGAGKAGEALGIVNDETLKYVDGQKQIQVELAKTAKAHKDMAQSIEDDVDAYVAKQQFKNIAIPEAEVKKQLDKSLGGFKAYYKAIGDEEVVLAIKRHELIEKYKDLTDNQIDAIINSERDKNNKTEKLAEEWAKRKIEIATNISIAEQDKLAEPFIKLEAKYKEDLEKFKGNKEAKLMLTNEYNAEVARLQKDLTEKFNEEEDKKAKKSAEWQVKILEANEKYNDEIIKMQDEMYGTDSSVEQWYNNQLEYLGKLSQEAGATSEELQTLLDKIETIKAMKLEKQTISFKVEQSFYQSFESNLADSIEGAFNGKLNLSSFFSNIGRSVLGTFSGGIANNITTGLRTGSFASGLKALGLGSTSAAASDGGILSDLSTLSTIKSIYGLASDGLSSTVLSGFNSIAGGFDALGMTGAGDAIGQFGYGFANPFTANTSYGAIGVGSTVGGMAIGGLGGYALGSIGDKVFGAETKAGTYGAIGGAIGSVVPVIGTIAGAAIGAAIGGMFGSTKQTDAGLSFGTATGMGQGFDEIQAYADMKKKSWFSSKKWTNYTDLSDSEVRQIKGIFDTYDYLLAQLGDTDRIILEAGKYTGQSFQDVVAKKFIEAFTDVSQSTDDTIYQAWVKYAESVDSTVIEALSASINTFIATTRAFDVWALNRSGKGIEALAQQAQWAQEDFENLSNMLGVTGVTVENYTQMYKEAVKNSLSPETITQWQSLGTALQSATNAADAYKNSILSGLQQDLTAWIGALGSIQNAMDNLNPTFMTFAELASQTINLDNYSTLLSQLEKTRQNEIEKLTQSSNERIKQLEDEKTLFLTISEFVDELTQKIIGYSVTTSSYFFSELANAKSLISSGGTPDISSLKSSASSYLDKALGESTSKIEYLREVAKVREGIGGLGSLVTGGSLEGIESAIKQEEETLASKLDEINKTALAILAGYKGTATGAISGISNQISNVQTFDPTITAAYQEILGRTPEAEGGAYWQSQLTSGNLNTSNITQAMSSAAVDELYRTVLGREADAEGKAFWQSAVESGAINPTQLDEQFKEAAKAELAINGSHASGLDYVPFDGYIAELHKGERVQTASEVQKDSIINELQNSLKDLKDMFIKNIAETSRMSRVITRLDDNDALLVRVVV